MLSNKYRVFKRMSIMWHYPYLHRRAVAATSPTRISGSLSKRKTTGVFYLDEKD
jgi:hypothetical protein